MHFTQKTNPLKRDKANLDLFWLKNTSLEDSDAPQALDLFASISEGLK